MFIAVGSTDIQIFEISSAQNCDSTLKARRRPNETHPTATLALEGRGAAAEALHLNDYFRSINTFPCEMRPRGLLRENYENKVNGSPLSPSARALPMKEKSKTAVMR